MKWPKFCSECRVLASFGSKRHSEATFSQKNRFRNIILHISPIFRFHHQKSPKFSVRRKFKHMPLFFLNFVAKSHKRQKARVLASEILDIYSIRSNFEVLRCQLTAKKSAISLIFGGWTWICRFRFWFRILQTAVWSFVSCHELQKRLHFGFRDFGHLPLLFKHRRFRLHLGHCEEHNFTNIWRKLCVFFLHLWFQDFDWFLEDWCMTTLMFLEQCLLAWEILDIYPLHSKTHKTGLNLASAKSTNLSVF